MKRIIKILVLMLILAGFATISLAANVSLNLTPSKTKVEVGQEVKVKISVNEFTREGTQKAIELKLGFENSKIEIKKVEGKNGWTVTTSSDKTGIVASKESEVSSNEEVAEITFAVKADAQLGNTQITAQNILTSADGDEEEAVNTSTVIEITKKEAEPINPGEDGDGEDEGGNQPGKEDSDNGGQNNGKSTKDGDSTGTGNGTAKDDTTAKKENPYTGVEDVILPIGIVAIFSVGTFIGYRRYKAY